MQVANVTATKDGETLENAADVSESDLAALLDYADDILVHEVYNEEWVEDRKARYPAEWDGKVTLLTDTTGEGEGSKNGENDDEGTTCRHADCDADATQKAVCEQGQEKHYCDEHAGGRRAGHALVEEWVSL